MQARGCPSDEDELDLIRIWSRDLWKYRPVYRRVSMACWNLNFRPGQVFRRSHPWP